MTYRQKISFVGKKPQSAASQSSFAGLRNNVSAFIVSRLDYCNSVLIGLSWSTIAPLQHVQNAAAQLVTGLSARDHVGPALRELHWLPHAHHMKFKVALRMYTIVSDVWCTSVKW